MGSRPGGPRRLQQLIIGLSLLAVVAAIGVYVAGHHGLDPADRWAGRLIGSEPRSTALRVLADLGDPFVVAVAAVVTAVISLMRRDAGRAVACLAGPALAGVLTEFVFKPLVDGNGVVLSYPSGHTTGVAALVSVAILASFRWRVIVAALGAAVLVAVCGAVIALGWHTLTEAVAGAFVGSGSVLVARGAVPALRLTRARSAPARERLQQ